MVQKIIILGSTGSIGTQSLEVIDSFPQEFEVLGLSAAGNIDLLEKQIRRYRPQFAAVLDNRKARELRRRLNDLHTTTVLEGENGIIELASLESASVILVALVGFSGLKPTLAAVRKGKKIALANKEALVTGGELIMTEARKNNSFLIPVDSEHSAIFQCLHAGKPAEIARIILTASGGPFRDYTKDDLRWVTPTEALRHPNWDMGAKITIDSATMMNKGFEVLEASWLFQLPLEQIEVVIHPQSIVHSMVEFLDGSLIAQMGMPDMQLPIQYALTYPERWESRFPRLAFKEILSLEFLPPDKQKFTCLELAYQAGRIGGTMPAVLNAANEIAVAKYLQNKISFVQIPELLETIMNRHMLSNGVNLDEIVHADEWARKEAETLSL